MKRTAARVIPAQIFLGFVLSTLVIAQSTTTLSGTVKDAKGAPVPSAKVSLKNSSTGQTTEATADAQGAYHLLISLPASTNSQLRRQDSRQEPTLCTFNLHRRLRTLH